MNKTIRSASREIIYKVYRRCLAEHEAQTILSDLDNIYQRTADMTKSDGSDDGFEDRQNQNRDNERDSGGAGGPGGPGGGGGGGPGGGGGGGNDDDDDEEDDNGSDSTGGDSDEERPYDISIAASHSYLGPGLVCVGGRAVLEAGWRGRVPAAAHHGVVFPGETVPMLLAHAPDAALLVQAIKHDKLFGLLCPDVSGSLLSGYGVLCEVMMAGIEEAQDEPTSVTFKARAIHRFRLLKVPRLSVPIRAYARMRFVEVMVLPEMSARDTLRASRLASLDPLRASRLATLDPPRASRLATLDPPRASRLATLDPPRASRLATLDPLRTPAHLAPVQQRLRAMDAAATPWPLFVYDIFELERMRSTIRDYFTTLALQDKLPDEPVSLSFWVASNLALSVADRLALFAVDNALLRLHMECHFIHRKSVLCCSSCMTQIARREHIFAMSSEGVHSNYTNLGGYMHDILTVSQATHVETSGEASAEYSWFPGYTWSVALCATCMAHVGWRFEAMKRNLRPYKFFGLCRNYVQPHTEAERAHPQQYL